MEKMFQYIGIGVLFVFFALALISLRRMNRQEEEGDVSPPVQMVQTQKPKGRREKTGRSGEMNLCQQKPTATNGRIFFKLSSNAKRGFPLSQQGESS